MVEAGGASWVQAISDANWDLPVRRHVYAHLQEFDDYLAMVEAAPELYGDVMAAPSGMQIAPDSASPDRAGGAAPTPPEGMVPANLSDDE